MARETPILLAGVRLRRSTLPPTVGVRGLQGSGLERWAAAPTHQYLRRPRDLSLDLKGHGVAAEHADLLPADRGLLCSAYEGRASSGKAYAPTDGTGWRLGWISEKRSVAFRQEPAELAVTVRNGT
jgi:hypothetical protein